MVIMKETNNQPILSNETKDAIERALMDGDLSRLDAEQKLAHYQSVCTTIGLNPLTKPFQYITLNGKLQMYALKGATDQLRKIYNISSKITNTETINDLYIVRVEVKDNKGRIDEDMGFARIKDLNGDALGNAMLKAVTKAKRRATLSMCGLGMLDEDEVKSIPPINKKEETDLNNHLEDQVKKLNVSEPKPEEESNDTHISLMSDEPLIDESNDIKDSVYYELQEKLGINILGFNNSTKSEGVPIEEIHTVCGAKEIPGFTAMCNLYSEKQEVWAEQLSEKDFKDIKDFCISIKNGFSHLLQEDA